MNGRHWAAALPGPLPLSACVARGKRVAWLIIALLVLLAHAQARPVAAQEAERPSRCDNWQLTGRWSAATTEAGKNRSLVNTTLHLVQRGSLLVGRWTPLEGREVVVEGNIAAGIARLTFLKPDATRHLVLAVASDGTRIGGRWTEPGTEGGEFWARGEAVCPQTPAAVAAAGARTDQRLLPRLGRDRPVGRVLADRRRPVGQHGGARRLDAAPLAGSARPHRLVPVGGPLRVLARGRRGAGPAAQGDAAPGGITVG